MVMPRSTVPPHAAQALTLSERLAAFRAHGHLLGDQDIELSAGRRWIEKLRAMPPFDTLPHVWERFLTANQITEDTLQRALGAPAAFLAAHAPDACRWADELDQALADYYREARPPFVWPAAMGAQAKLLTFSRPVMVWAMKRLRQGLAGIEAACGRSLIDPERLEAMFLPPIVGTAFAITHRALVLELNIARLQGELAGDTPADRFESFVARLEEPARVRALYEEYAVLSRQLVDGLRSIADFALHFFRHLADDWTIIGETFFGGSDPGRLARATRSGDGHRGGQRVLVLELESGRKLLYKPHSLRVDEHFQALLQWLDAQGYRPSFRTMTCLDRGDHGWTEFVAAAGCGTEDELRRFYLRQGALLAVLYAMLGTDIHHENLIAAGEHPVLVDLESLFHPGLRPTGDSQLNEVVRGAMTYSVLRTALLPSLHFVGKSDVPVDFGGLSDVEGQQAPHPAPYVDMSVADEARIERMKTTMSGSLNIPTLQGAKPSPWMYTEEIVEGFTSMFRFLLAHRASLLAPDGPIRRFAGAEVRFIFRHTRTYALLGRETHHPDLQRNALDRDLHFARLWALLDEREDIAGLIDSELRSMWSGDVPFFYARTESVDLFDHEDRIHPELLARSCLDDVVEHIGRLDERDLERQIWFIRGAMACQQVEPGHNDAGNEPATTGFSFRPVPGAERSLSRGVYLEEACRVGDRLVTLAMRGAGDEGATWLGMVLLRDKIWQFLPLGLDLYNGLGGIALFLAHLARASGKDEYADLARGAVQVMRAQLPRSEKRILINGAFSGWGGLIYTYAHLAHLWQEPSLIEDALQCARHARARAGDDVDCEVIYGNAGGILALDSLYEIHPVDEVLDAMQACGQRILAQARPMERGMGWDSNSMGTVPLSGYSHGASGIASALEVLHRRTGQSAYLEAATSALAYERTLFSEEHRNWLDMRPYRGGEQPDRSSPANYPVAWCNGAPGVGMSRFRMPALRDATTRVEIGAAMDTTRRKGFGYTHCLCHGDLGNVELFLEARAAGHPPLEDLEIERYAAGILEGIRQRGWICGTPRGIETPGLMTGLAGIGYGFLRLHDAAGVPSILLLDPPR